jgi:hypothetical protein
MYGRAAFALLKLRVLQQSKKSQDSKHKDKHRQGPPVDRLKNPRRMNIGTTSQRPIPGISEVAEEPYPGSRNVRMIQHFIDGNAASTSHHTRDDFGNIPSLKRLGIPLLSSQGTLPLSSRADRSCGKRRDEW